MQNPLAEKVWGWLTSRVYNINGWSIHDFPVHITLTEKTNHSRPRCSISHRDYWDIVEVNIRIVEDREFWLTYSLNSVGLYAPTMPVTNQAAIEFQWVHELSHLIEFRKGRGMGDVQPTINELFYAYENYYEYFTNCKTLTDKRTNGTNSKFRCVVTDDIK